MWRLVPPPRGRRSETRPRREFPRKQKPTSGAKASAAAPQPCDRRASFSSASRLLLFVVVLSLVSILLPSGSTADCIALAGSAMTLFVPGDYAVLVLPYSRGATVADDASTRPLGPDVVVQIVRFVLKEDVLEEFEQLSAVASPTAPAGFGMNVAKPPVHAEMKWKTMAMKGAAAEKGAGTEKDAKMQKVVEMKRDKEEKRNAQKLVKADIEYEKYKQKERRRAQKMLEKQRIKREKEKAKGIGLGTWSEEADRVEEAENAAELWRVKLNPTPDFTDDEPLNGSSDSPFASVAAGAKTSPQTPSSLDEMLNRKATAPKSSSGTPAMQLVGFPGECGLYELLVDRRGRVRGIKQPQVILGDFLFRPVTATDWKTAGIDVASSRTLKAFVQG
eukprot:GHVT01009653.1.p1 GENE.GHVT01009653.1~~GHVT01009653.1.p1  ORF type:complete len:390 (-),score=102.04 GHVT01009653.1:530-1699(-)